MACPFFQPQRELDSGGWDPAPRLPLGAAWAGFCTAGISVASGAKAFEPPESMQRELCNHGYARRRCAYFPGEGLSGRAAGDDSQTSVFQSADAVRFSLLPSCGAEARLLFVLEQDHRPMGHGEIIFRDGDCFYTTPFPEAAPNLKSQARAFLESIMKAGENPEI